MIKQTLTLFRMGLFGAAHGTKRPPFPKLCHIHPTMMLLGTVISYPKKIQKTYKSCETPFEFRRYQHFFYRKSATFVVSRNTDIDCILIHNFNFFIFFESLQITLINKAVILMMSAKLDTLGLLKIKVFRNKGYDVSQSYHNKCKKLLYVLLPSRQLHIQS